MLLYDNIPESESKRISLHYGALDKVDYFNVSPKILPAGKSVKITVSSKNPAVKLCGTFLVMIAPYYDFPYIPFEEYKDKPAAFLAENGVLTVEHTFPSEQLYRFIIAEETEKGLAILLKTTVYALDEDLYNLQPLCGDFHSHTIYSDGFETPESVVSAAVRHRLDFIAVTDHNNYEGSVQAALAAKSKNLPITVINGEEYSSSFTNMHIISLGAKQPLGKWHYFPPVTEENKGNSCVEFTKELCQKIKENGGLSVMCHPLWKPFRPDGTRLDVPMSVVKDLMGADIFDAIEVVGGSPIEDNTTSNMQHIWAVSFGATPERAAYLGSTDSHTYSIDPICGKHFTLVLAKGKSGEDILDAVKNKLTVAVQVMDLNNVLCFGPPRLCMFAEFFVKNRLKQEN